MPALNAHVAVRRRPSSARQDLTVSQRRGLVAGAVTLHVALGWGLLQVPAVREMVAEASPVFISMVADEARPAPQVPVPPVPAPQSPAPVERQHRGEDDVGPHPAHLLVGQAETTQRAGPEVGDHHVGHRRQPEEGGPARKITKLRERKSGCSCRRRDLNSALVVSRPLNPNSGTLSISGI